MQFIPEINVIDLGNYVIETARKNTGPAVWRVWHNGRKVGKGNGSTVRDADRLARDYVARHQMTEV